MHKPRSRFVSLLAGALLLLAGVTCTDSPTGPRSGRGGSALIGFAPVFSQAAAEIYRSLVNFGLAVNNIHVRLEHANGTTAKDSVVILSGGQDSVVIELSVTLNSSTELLGAKIELRDGTTVLFSGTEDINARAGGLPASTPPINLAYTGPGASAKTFVVGPADATVFTTDSVTFTASAKDANGQNVPDIVVGWSVKDAARGSVDNAGKFKPSAGRGATYVLAKLPSGLRDSGHVNIVPPATKAAIISGGNQTATVGKPLPAPIVIEAQAGDNLPVPTAKLTFAVTGGGGSLSAATATTDANGRASVTLTLGSVAGSNTIEVAGAGIQPINVSATGAPDVAAKLVMSQQPSVSVIPNVTFPQQPQVQIQDALGNAVGLPNVSVTAALTDAAGRTLSGTLTVNTNDAGIAAFTDLKIAGPVGTTTLTFTAADITAASTSSMTLALGPPASIIAVSGDGQGSLPSQTLANPLIVKIVDVGGNALSGMSMTFNVTSGGGNLAGAPSATISTDASGQASTPWSVGTGVQAVTATAGGVTRELRAFIAEKVVIVSQPATSPQSGVPMSPQPVVRLADTDGNFVKLAGIVITANAQPTPPIGDYALFVTGGGIVTTDANGVATFADVAIQGDIEQHGVLKFYRLIGETIDASIAPGVSPEIAMQPGIPQQLVAEDVVEYHRMPAPVTTKTLAVVASDGYNNVPNWPIAFGVVSGSTNCSITTPTTVNTDGSGKASVNVATLASMSSCAVRAQVVFPPPPPCPECPPAEALPPPNVTHKLYVAPDDVKIWTGGASSTFPGSPGNWFNSDAPDAGKSIFIPVVSQFANGYAPQNDGSAVLYGSLTVETGATFMMNGEPLNLRGDLVSNGEIVGGGDLVLHALDPIHALSGTIHAKIIVASDTSCVASGVYVIQGPLTADDIWVQCTLQLNEAVDVSVSGDLRVPGADAQFLMTKGNLTVGGNLTVDNGNAAFSGGTATINGELIVQSAAYLAQTAGSILVGGDATFDGNAVLTDGLLELRKGFKHNGNCENQVFYATQPHRTHFTGDASSVLTFLWNTGCASRFGVLEFATRGSGGMLARTDLTFLAPIGVNKLIIHTGSKLEVTQYISINGDPGSGSLEIESGAVLRLQDIVPSVDCGTATLIRDDNFGPISCTFPAS